MSSAALSTIATPMSAWVRAFGYVVTYEGDGLDMTPSDPGNWTGGRVGVGTLKGSKFGVSAASYPNLDIANLTLADAQLIFKTDFWDKIDGDSWPPQLALCLVDAEWNNGPGLAPEMLQEVVGAGVDGMIGPITEGDEAATLASIGINGICAAYNAKRLQQMAQMGNWMSARNGWIARIVQLSFDCVTFAAQVAADQAAAAAASALAAAVRAAALAAPPAAPSAPSAPTAVAVTVAAPLQGAST